MQRLGRGGGVVIHEQHMGKALCCGLQQAAGKTARAAQIGIGKAADFGVRGDLGTVSVVDDKAVHLRAKLCPIKVLRQAKRGGLNLGFAAKGCDHNRQAQTWVGLRLGHIARRFQAGVGGDGTDLKGDQAQRLIVTVMR